MTITKPKYAFPCSPHPLLPSSELWAIRGVTQVYFGSASDIPAAWDYDGDGFCEVGIFRKSSGLWAIRGVTRAYFGSAADQPVPGYFQGRAPKNIAIFRPSSGLWAVRSVTQAYFRELYRLARTGRL